MVLSEIIILFLTDPLILIGLLKFSKINDLIKLFSERQPSTEGKNINHFSIVFRVVVM